MLKKTQVYANIQLPYTTRIQTQWYEIDDYTDMELLKVKIYLTYRELEDTTIFIIDRDNVAHFATITSIVNDGQYDIMTLGVAKGVVSNGFKIVIDTLSSNNIKILGSDFDVIPRRMATKYSKGRINHGN